MTKLDYEYICKLIGNLSGVPIRLYRGSIVKYYYSFVALPADPISPYLDKILSFEKHIGYFITPNFHYYGIIAKGNMKIVVGPSMETASSEHDLKELALMCNVPREKTDEFVSGINSIVRMPLTSVMQMMCAINYIVNGEKVGLGDITIYETEQKRLTTESLSEREDIKSDAFGSDAAVHNTLLIERTIMDMVESGDIEGLEEWAKNAPAVRSGVLAADYLRQLKNTFIVTTTLASRAAIRGGLDAEDALSLSDAYIRKCERLNSQERIMNMQYYMISDYTKRVHAVRLQGVRDPIVASAANFIVKNISEPINVADVANALFISRSVISTRFKASTGVNLSDFIVDKKIEEAKRLLTYTKSSVSDISEYLAFSSQSHFSAKFKQKTGMTPNEYRKSGVK